MKQWRNYSLHDKIVESIETFMTDTDDEDN